MGGLPIDTGYVGVPNNGSAAVSGNCAAQRAVRGGAYVSEPARSRVAWRVQGAQGLRTRALGFRVTRAL